MLSSYNNSLVDIAIITVITTRIIVYENVRYEISTCTGGGVGGDSSYPIIYNYPRSTAETSV